ncbi:MAG TPA: hypothetical protein PKM41_08685 [Deltaproteobacteria bacterium]|nr:hypothetical protein [Deltaproteobacteria bacterium]
MQKMRVCLLVMFVLTFLSLAGCGHHDEIGGSGVPVQLEVSTENIQERVGLSGFIFGTFLLLNAYFVIVASCIALMVKEQTFKKISDTIRTVSQMLNPSQGQDGSLLKILGLLSNAETRFQLGSLGMIIGLILAYFGAWVAT